jgi:hypothetical protein
VRETGGRLRRQDSAVVLQGVDDFQPSWGRTSDAGDIVHGVAFKIAHPHRNGVAAAAGSLSGGVRHLDCIYSLGSPMSHASTFM